MYGTAKCKHCAQELEIYDYHKYRFPCWNKCGNYINLDHNTLKGKCANCSYEHDNSINSMYYVYCDNCKNCSYYYGCEIIVSQSAERNIALESFDIQQKLYSANQMIKNLTDQLDERNRIIKEMEYEYDTSRNQFNAEFNETKLSLSNANAEIELLKQELSKQNDTCKQLQYEADANFNDTKPALTIARNTIKDLKNELSAQQSLNEILKHKIDEYKRATNDLKQQIYDRDKSYQELQASYDETIAKLDSANTEIESLKLNKTKLQSKLDATSLQLSKVSSEYEAFKSIQTKDNKNLHNKINHIRSKLKSTKKRLKQISSERDDIKQRIVDANDTQYELKTANDKIKAFNFEITRYKQQLSDSKVCIETLNAKINTLMNKEDDYKCLQQSLKTLTAKQNKLKKLISEKITTIRILTSELELARDMQLNLQLKIDELIIQKAESKYVDEYVQCDTDISSESYESLKIRLANAIAERDFNREWIMQLRGQR